MLKDSKYVQFLFIDFSKAFDSVELTCEQSAPLIRLCIYLYLYLLENVRVMKIDVIIIIIIVLINMLIKCNIDHNIIKWIVYFLIDRDQYTKLGDQLSFLRVINRSIVQGSGIGPTLFNYIYL